MSKKRLYAVTFVLAAIVTLASCGIRPDEARISSNTGGEPALGLAVYFIDVGQADSSLVICDGAAMLIDGGNAADSDLIYAFLKNYDVSHLDYIVGTHAHEDHIGGLAGALNYATVDTAYCPVTEHDSEVFSDFVTYLEKQSKSITVPIPGDIFKLGGSYVEIIAPIKPSDNINDTSIVLRLTYGEISFLFTGDCEREEEADILDAGYDVSADVLKVGHHGSETSTSYPFLREIMPQYAVISCGRNNSYGHPDDDTLSRLRDADTVLYRTDMQGTITATSDGSTVAFSTERNTGAQTNQTFKPNQESQTAAAEQTSTTTLTSDTAEPSVHEYYIGNKNTHSLHSPDCNNLPDEKNRVRFDSLDEALADGYRPHKNCLQ
jgi:competence protein ComEC